MTFARLLLAALLATAAMALGAAPVSAATTGPCFPGGPTCTFWTGKVKLVADGDTIDVDIAGDGTSAKQRVRMAGYNAMELTRYSIYQSRRRGECHGVSAAGRLEQMIRRSGRRVRLAAQHESSRGSGRLRRQVSVLVDGAWVDVAPTMLAEGRALWYPASDEWAWNRSYAAYARQAEAAGIGIWNPQGCGAGPASKAALSIRVSYHQYEVDETKYLNSEWVQVVNSSAYPVSLNRWWVRDTGLLRYHFPSSAVVAAGGRLTLYIGRGADRPGSRYFWGLPKPTFNNPSNDRVANGDGAFLYDSRGNMRAHQLWGG